MFEAADWDDAECGPQLSALTWGVAKSKQTNGDIANIKMTANLSKKKKKKSKDITNDKLKTENSLENKIVKKKNELTSKMSRKIAEKVTGKNGLVSTVDRLINTPSSTIGLLDNTTTSPGSLLTRGIKFSSSNAFLRFMGMPSKNKHGSKRNTAITNEVEEQSECAKGTDNEAFNAVDTPVKSDLNLPKSKKRKLDIAKLADHLAEQDQSSISTTQSVSNSLVDTAKTKLSAARFRFMNDKLYCQESSASVKLFKSDSSLFSNYHEGYQIQARQWPLNPLDLIIKDILKMPNNNIIADIGCGEARLAKSVPNEVHSFDLVAVDDSVVACDMAKLPLGPNSVHVAVFCLSLMGTNLRDFVFEASRILKLQGTLKIAELESRFQGQDCGVEDFIKNVEKFGFKLLRKDLTKNFFYFLDFEKVKEVKKKKLPDLELKPCFYKKR